MTATPQTSLITSFTTFDVTATLTTDVDHPGWFASMVVVVVQFRRGLVTGRESHRFGLGFVSARGVSRRVYRGPELPGPWAYAIPLPPTGGPTVEMGRLRDLGLVIDAALGDRLVFQGSTYVIERGAGDNIKLTPVTS